MSVSMGVDSVAAFIWMKSKGYNVVPIHFNHKLRPQNDLMQEKFDKLCSTFTQPHGSSSCDLMKQVSNYLTTCHPDYQSKTEAECREQRLKFYQNVSNRAMRLIYGGNEIPVIITAHHLNDYVENYLLNCFRGHPTHVPIEFESYFNPPEDDNPDLFNTSYKVIHPFLLTRKRDFRQYLERNNYMKYVVEDETNKITKGSRRNWIRNSIIPEMQKNKLSLEKYAKRKIEDGLKLKSFVLQSTGSK